MKQIDIYIRLYGYHIIKICYHTINYCHESTKIRRDEANRYIHTPLRVSHIIKICYHTISYCHESTKIRRDEVNRYIHTPVRVSHIIKIWHHTYMLFTSREVRIGKNCARRLGYRGIQDRGHSFSQYGPT